MSPDKQSLVKIADILYQADGEAETECVTEYETEV